MSERSGVLMYTGPDADEATDQHEGYVAGRRADGTLTDIWTDTERPAPGVYTGYVPRCECGWIGSWYSPTARGYVAAEQAWRDGHLNAFLADRPPPRASIMPPTVVHGGFVPEEPSVRCT